MHQRDVLGLNAAQRRAMMPRTANEEGAFVKGADKQKKLQKKAAQKTLKEKRSEKRAKEAARQ